MSRIILDSNAYTEFFQGNKAIKETIDKSTTVVMSVIVIGELLAAFKKGNQERTNKRQLEQFLSKPSIEFAEAGRETAAIYSEIKHQLDQTGKPIPLNDIWIAAHAMETGSVLVTYDKHFLNIPGLRLWDYLVRNN